jgi:hypothetical protein
MSPTKTSKNARDRHRRLPSVLPMLPVEGTRAMRASAPLILFAALVAAAPTTACASPTSLRIVARVLHIAPTMSARRARRELEYLDRQYARTEPSLVSWRVSGCRHRSRTADNCRERDVWGPGSNGMTVPNVCFTRVALETTPAQLVEFTYGPTTCYSLARAQPQVAVFGLPPHPSAKVTQPFGVLGKVRERRQERRR